MDDKLKDFYGIELLPFQKVMMRMLNNKKNKKFLIMPIRSGRTYYYVLSEIIKILYGDKNND